MLGAVAQSPHAASLLVPGCVEGNEAGRQHNQSNHAGRPSSVLFVMPRHKTIGGRRAVSGGEPVCLVPAEVKTAWRTWAKASIQIFTRLPANAAKRVSGKHSNGQPRRVEYPDMLPSS
ncbi:hypothetical protein S40293_10621 [Stachybotrys chartarum IBT 40293]|nr:hypothetical protein S40293_10621 [Stachybotrys chartarum IBT 40293]